MLDRKLSARVDEIVRTETEGLTKLSLDIHQNPELRWAEHKATAWICDYLEARGFAVERNLGGLATAFRARAGKAGGPQVAILAEYDALPEIGHACGHNLIAAGAVGAFVAAAPLAAEAGGEIVLLGTPAEEGGGGKIRLIDAGAFAGLDAAMMFHPFDRDMLAHPALASLWLACTFKGQPAHAAAAPHMGRSALTACMDTFHLVDGQRVHFKDGVRVHGFVTNGGQAVNIIAEHAACELSIRATDVTELARVRAIVERCARAAAMASDVQVELKIREGYRDMRNNMTLARAFGSELLENGRAAKERDPRVGAGSTDMGDVSHVVPSIHPYLSVVDEGAAQIHDHSFVAAAGSERGLSTAMIAARTMAKTALRVLADGELRTALRAEFEGT
ncbi:M20 family metallopeptidase [soil metagenome]